MHEIVIKNTDWSEVIGIQSLHEFKEHMIKSLGHPILYKFFPSITFYFYKDYLFIRPAYSNISETYQCTSKQKLAAVIAELLEPFGGLDQNLDMLLYQTCLKEVRLLQDKYCKKRKKKCKNQCN